MTFLIQTSSQYQFTSPWKFTNNYKNIILDTSKYKETNLQFNTIYRPYILTELTQMITCSVLQQIHLYVDRNVQFIIRRETRKKML